MVCVNTQTAECTTECIKIIKNTDREFTYGQMDVNTMENGLMACNMGLANKYLVQG